MVVTPAASGIIPLLGLVILVVCGALNVRRCEGHALRALLISLVFIVVLAAAAVMCFLGLYAGSIPMLVIFSIAQVVFGVMSQSRSYLVEHCVPKVSGGNEARRQVLIGVRDVVLILAAAVLTVLGLETSYNDWFTKIALNFYLIEYVIVLCVLAVLYFLAGRRGAGAVIGVIAITCIGVAQYFVYSFKVAPIMPSDLFVLGTALAVSGNYDYIIDGRILTGAIYSGAAICLLGFITVKKNAGQSNAKTGLKRYVPCFIAACLCAGMLGYFVTVPNYAKDGGVHVDSWFTYDSYRMHGWLTTFTTVAQDMVVEKPEGYTKEGTQELVEAKAAEYQQRMANDADAASAQKQFEEKQPCVVAIMNETFSDISVYEELHAGYQGPNYFKNELTDTITRGDVTVSVNGGGTCNSEFEFLTGNTMAFFGTGMYPYSTYKFDNCQGLASQFNELGYTTTAMHPNFPSNWARDVIYKKMGFETFLSVDDFPNASKVHNEVSDEATYDKVLELLENDDSPQFIFDVTMQNHSGYSRGDIPEQFQTNYVPSDWGNEDQVAALNEYLGCIESSDDALKNFIAQLEQLDRPVVVVFFGDHQPGFSKDINEAFFEDDGSAEFVQRVYYTGYFIWANYDVAGAERYTQDNPTSTSYLSALLMESIGAPMSDFQMAQLQTCQDLPQLNLYGFTDSEGNKYLFDDELADPEAESPDSEQNAPQECIEALDFLERAQYARFIDK